MHVYLFTKCVKNNTPNLKTLLKITLKHKTVKKHKTSQKMSSSNYEHGAKKEHCQQTKKIKLVYFFFRFCNRNNNTSLSLVNIFFKESFHYVYLGTEKSDWTKFTF